MAARSVVPPFKVFTDVDGDPLESGYIYVGTEGLDPVTNPINVYWDDALTIPAVQPIRTIGGYPSNSGSPGALFASSDYSITVKDKNLSQVLTSSSSTSEIPVATGTKVGGVLSGTDITVDATGNVEVVNDSHTHDAQYYTQSQVDTDRTDRRKLYASETTTHEMTADSDYTLTADQNLYGRINITDTVVTLTTSRNIILDTSIRSFIAVNSTAQDLTFKTSAGTGVAVLAGASQTLYCDGTNIISGGAIVESASNANGEYIRYSDGTLVCTSSVLFDGTIGTTAQSYTTPYVFEGTTPKYMSVSISTGNANYTAVMGGLHSFMSDTDTSTFWLKSTVNGGSAANMPVRVTMIGRWF